MADTFGMSHRQTVRDVNAGRLSSDGGASAPKGRRSGAQFRAATQEVGVRLPEGDQLVANALIKAAGTAGEVITREQKRKQMLEGAKMAGTEEGRAKIQEEKDTLANKLFGPNAKIRAAEERIVSDEVDRISMKLSQDLDEFGHQMDDEAWNAHVDDATAEMLDKYTDDDLKDQIAVHFAANTAPLTRERTKKREVYVQGENRRTFQNNATTRAEAAQLDLDSGDPDRQADAEARIASIFKKPEGMSDAAYHSSLADVMKNELTHLRVGMYEYAEKNGILDGMAWEDKLELQTARDMYDAKMDEKTITALSELDAMAEMGDISSTVELARKMATKYPVLFPKGIAPYVEAAWDAATEKEAAARELTTNKSLANSGRDLSQLKPAERIEAIDGGLTDMATAELRAELAAEAKRTGQHYDPNAPVSREHIKDWLARNPEKWGRNYLAHNEKTPLVKEMIDGTLMDLGSQELTDQEAKRLDERMGALAQLHKMHPDYFSNLVDDAGDLTKITTYARDINSGRSRAQVIQMQRERDARAATGMVHTPTKEQTERAGREGVRMFLSEHRGWLDNFGSRVWGAIQVAGELAQAPLPDFIAESTPGEDWYNTYEIRRADMADLELKFKNDFEAAFAISGNYQDALEFAKNANVTDAAVQGNRIIVGGGKLNTKFGTWDKYVTGINDDENMRMLLATQHNLPEDFNLLDARTIPNPDGSGATLMIMDNNGYEVPINLSVPQQQEDMLPSAGEKRWQWLKDTIVMDRADYVTQSQQAAVTLAAEAYGEAPDSLTVPQHTFTKALAEVENGVRSGYNRRTQRWSPHKSAEGGNDTIAYGHKLTDAEVRSNSVMINGESVSLADGLTESQAKSLLKQDIEKHTEKVRGTISDFDQLPERYQQILVNIAFNVGSVTEKGWPKLLKAMRAGDDRTVRQEMITSYKDASGKRHQLTNRAKQIADAVGLQ